MFCSAQISTILLFGDPSKRSLSKSKCDIVEYNLVYTCMCKYFSVSLYVCVCRYVEVGFKGIHTDFTHDRYCLHSGNSIRDQRLVESQNAARVTANETSTFSCFHSSPQPERVARATRMTLLNLRRTYTHIQRRTRH